MATQTLVLEDIDIDDSDIDDRLDDGNDFPDFPEEQGGRDESICRYDGNGLCAEVPTHFIEYENYDDEESSEGESSEGSVWKYCKRHYAYTLGGLILSARDCECPVNCNKGVMGFGAINGRCHTVKPSESKAKLIREVEKKQNDGRRKRSVAAEEESADEIDVKPVAQADAALVDMTDDDYAETIKRENSVPDDVIAPEWKPGYHICPRCKLSYGGDSYQANCLCFPDSRWFLCRKNEWLLICRSPISECFADTSGRTLHIPYFEGMILSPFMFFQITRREAFRLIDDNTVPFVWSEAPTAFRNIDAPRTHLIRGDKEQFKKDIWTLTGEVK